MVCSMACLACNAISHLLACRSHRLNLFLWRLDYAGIPIMILFFCSPNILRLSLQFFISPRLPINHLRPGHTCHPHPTCFSSLLPGFRPIRAALFLIMGFSGVVPAVHAVVINWEHQQCHLALGLEVAMGLAYATGVGFYVTQVPEQWKPCALDIAGHSHQIFHVFVLVGALTHYADSNVLLDVRDGGAGCTAPSATLPL